MFAIGAVGASPDTIHALLHCRGDINAPTCRVCTTGAFEDAHQLCAYIKDATVFYELCLLRYSNQDFLRSTRGTSNDDDFDDIFVLCKNQQNASTPAAVFDAAVGVLLNATADYAATSPMRFGTGVHQDTPRIFSLVLCVPSPTPAECGRCLAYVVGNIGASCSCPRSCMVCRLSCGFVYQQSRFYSGSPLVHPPPVLAPSAAAPAAASSGHPKGDRSVACTNLSSHHTPLIQLVNMHVDQSIASIRLCIILYPALIN
jgi:hypothetical protein